MQKAGDKDGIMHEEITIQSENAMQDLLNVIIADEEQRKAEREELSTLRKSLQKLREELERDGETHMLFHCPACDEESSIEPWLLLFPATTFEKCPECRKTWRIVVEFFEVK